MAARKIKGTKTAPWHDVVRERLRGAMLEKTLTQYIDGKRELSGGQVTAALGLLKKILPDVTQNETTVSGELNINIMQFSGRNDPK